MSDTAESWLLPQGRFFAQPSNFLLDCAFAEENAAGFALGALSDDEQIRYVQHLAWCPTCARMLHEERKTVGYLPFLSPQVAPPASAKPSLFARIAVDQQLNPATLERATPLLMIGAGGFDLSDSPLGLTIASDVAPSKQHRFKRRFSWEMAAAPLAAVPLVFALAIVGGWALHTQNRLDRQAAQTHVLEDQNRSLAAQIAMLQTSVESDKMRTLDLDTGQAVTGTGAGGNLLAIDDQSYATLTVWNLPPASDGYEVLVETQTGEMQRAGNFTVDVKGNAILQLNIANPIGDYQAIHVLQLSKNSDTAPDQAVDQQDVLWMDLDSNLGGQSGTEANAKAH